MRLHLVDALGFVAGMLTTISFIPQLVHSWRTRDLSGISLRMYLLFTAGVALWLMYGFALGNGPIAITNGITLVLAGVILILKLVHRDHPPRPPADGATTRRPSDTARRCLRR